MLSDEKYPMPPKVTLCQILKNEEKNLPACLDSVADLVDEIIVIDTGSTDATKQVAARYGARIHDFPWIDDFAAARNESMRRATGRWIFLMDADDRIDQENRQRLRTVFSNLKDEEDAAYFMRWYCIDDVKQTVNSAYDRIHLFRNRPGLRWQYRIHEQIHPCLESLHYTIYRADVNIFHVGYQDPAVVERKHERNLRILQRERADRPDDAFVLFNLGLTCQGMARWQESLAFYLGSLQRVRPGEYFERKLYAMTAKVSRQLGQTAEAARLCQEGRKRYPHDADLLTQEAWICYIFGDYAGTEARFLQLLNGPKDDGIELGADPGLRGAVTRHNLAVLYRSQRRDGDAEAQWRAAVAEQPYFTEAWLGLGELYLAQARWQEMEQVLTWLEANPRTRIEGAILRAQKQLFHREFASARQLLEATLADAPQSLGLRLVLSRVLIQEGSDLAAAEKALRGVLDLDPNHQEARQNLDFVLRQQRRG